MSQSKSSQHFIFQNIYELSKQFSKLFMNSPFCSFKSNFSTRKIFQSPYTIKSVIRKYCTCEVHIVQTVSALKTVFTGIMLGLHVTLLYSFSRRRIGDRIGASNWNHHYKTYKNYLFYFP